MLKLTLLLPFWITAAAACGSRAKVPEPIVLDSALPEVVIHCSSPLVAQTAASRFGLQLIRVFRSDASMVLLRAKSLDQAERALNRAVHDPSVISAFQNNRLVWRKDFTPNDPYYNPNHPTAGWPGQWALHDTVSNLDIEAPSAWALGSGTNVVVGIVDDGVETGHPDLTTNYSSANSYDFGQNDANPNPVTAEDNHGTALAGLIAGRGGNGVGITGVMATGKWAGLRLDFDNLTTAQVVDATLVNSGTISIKNHSYGPISPFVLATAESNAITTSSASGTIHVRSAGNLRGTISEDANKAMVRNNVSSITVAAINSNGRFADYSSFGACIFACAPSGGVTSGLRPILTTDRFTGDAGFNKNGSSDSDALTDGAYTSLFGTDFDGGTSVAAGLVSGALGIAKELQPQLKTRMAKHLIARTSKQIDAGDASAEGDLWRTNGAGIKFNQNYGFGLINAGAITTQATQWGGVSALETETVGPTTVAAAIPDNNATGLSRTFNLTGTSPLEEVQITLNATHAYRGDLEAYLTSPSGLTSRLFASHLGDDQDNISWTFTTNAFWGESPAGQWTLKVADRGASDTGTWTNYTVNARMGKLVRLVTGTLSYGDIAYAGPIPVTVELRNQTSGVLISTHLLNVAHGGSFSIETQVAGAFKAVFITPNWLRRTISSTMVQGSASLGAVNLTNGDANQSLEVDPIDIDLVVSNFGNSGPGPLLGDLNWSSEVDPIDIDIAISNFGASGD